MNTVLHAIRILEIITNILFCCFQNKAYDKCFKRKYPFSLTLIVNQIHMFLLPKSFDAVLNELPVFLINVVLLFFPLLILYNGKIVHKLLLIAMSALLQILSELIICTVLLFLSVDIFSNLETNFIILRFIAPFIYYINYKILIAFNNVIMIYSNKVHLALTCYFLGQYLIYVQIESTLFQYSDYMVRFLNIVIYLILFLINLFLLYSIYSSIKLERKIEKLEYENKLLNELYQITIKDEEKIIKLRHDINNHILTIDVLIETSDIESAKRYYEEIKKVYQWN